MRAFAPDAKTSCAVLLNFTRKYKVEHDHDNIILSPLIPNSIICTPPGLQSTLHRVQICNFISETPYVHLAQTYTTERPKRRAESLQDSNSSRFPGSRLRFHSSRQHIQLALYKFALQTCLDFPQNDSKSFSDQSNCANVLLDLGSGDTGLVTLVSLVHKLSFFCIGIDLSSPSECTAVTPDHSDRLICDLSRSSAQHPSITLPLRNGCIDVVLSISFLQWLTAASHNDLSGVVSRFFSEVNRVLTPVGHCIVQFYPFSSQELDLVCHSISTLSPSMSGCRIYARPVTNRGFKIFLYTRRTL